MLGSAKLLQILRKLIVVPDHCLPPLVPVPYARSNHPLKLFHLQTRIDVYKYSFLPRTIIQRNKLPLSDIERIDIDTFKNNLFRIICNISVLPLVGFAN